MYLFKKIELPYSIKKCLLRLSCFKYIKSGITNRLCLIRLDCTGWLVNQPSMTPYIRGSVGRGKGG